MSAAFVNLVAVLPTQQKICDSQGGYGHGKDKRKTKNEERKTHTQNLSLCPLNEKAQFNLLPIQ